ncbi:hypothetical protein GSI_01401 [Ganoderma sinense ZZ0214-1]|uniref:Uncharacterized protein n=1 Tax=Ganoderma sinense ZZ0214-1 TaxID=1077348 RepID=A0A2G8SVA9_9APHY|nr:hypothetical protein GSI_01401 [Ganoderma sinense ZZ0214-1]
MGQAVVASRAERLESRCPERQANWTSRKELSADRERAVASPTRRGVAASGSPMRVQQWPEKGGAEEGVSARQRGASGRRWPRGEWRGGCLRVGGSGRADHRVRLGRATYLEVDEVRGSRECWEAVRVLMRNCHSSGSISILCRGHPLS